jgi:type II secretory pathway component GspD/PulD (secretin)
MMFIQKSIVALIISCLAAPAIFAQQPKAEPVEQKSMPEGHVNTVFRIQHANCKSLSQALSMAIPGCMCACIDNSSDMVFSADPKDIERARDLIEKLDKPAAERAGTIAKVSVKHRRVEELGSLLMSLAGGSELRMGIDRGGGRILLRGSEAHVKQAQALIESLDVPVSTVFLQFSLLRADAGQDQSKDLPVDLKQVADEMGHMGSLSLIGRLSATALEGEKFQVTGSFEGGLPVQIKGRVELGQGNESIVLQLSAEAKLVQASSDSAEKGKAAKHGYFDLETTLSLQPGDFAVVGSAPSGIGAGQSIVLVVQVKR